jgi:CDP-diacylglycerol--serine O-phosphatidyltransferase
VFAFPSGPEQAAHAVPVLAVVIVPALLMVSTIRFRSFKTFDLQLRRSYTVLMLVALGLAVGMASPEIALVAMAYAYLASGIIGLVWGRLRRRHHVDPAEGPTGGTTDSHSA